MPPKRACEEAIEQLKRTKSAVDEAFAELVCPITQSLPIDPVTAEDGNVYERHAIADWLKKNKRSPLTNVAMGDRLLPALKVKNLIRAMVKSGAITGVKADAWQAMFKEEENVEEWRRRAEAGEGWAMYNMGGSYDKGRGLPKDATQALAWFRRADAAGHAGGTGALGVFIAAGYGGATASAHKGAALMAEAAGRGSQMACANLGKAFAEGHWGFPKDPAMARRWYLKVAGASIKDAGDHNTVEVAQWLRDHPA